MSGKVVHCGRCEACGKFRFTTRKAARKAARQLQYVRTNEYECDGYWHIGHLPPAVVRGRISRDALQPPRRR